MERTGNLLFGLNLRQVCNVVHAIQTDQLRQQVLTERLLAGYAMAQPRGEGDPPPDMDDLPDVDTALGEYERRLNEDVQAPRKASRTSELRRALGLRGG